MAAMNPRIALASLALCVPCLVAQPAPRYSARFDMSQGIPLVKVRINGQGPFLFVLDTGTNCEAIVAPRLVHRLGLSATGRQSITDLGGHGGRSLDTVELTTLSFAATDFHSIPALVTDLPDGDSVLDGILGFGLFRDHLLTLDYLRHRVILDQGSLAGSSEEHTIRMRTPHGIPIVEIAVAGSRVPAAIDSGALGLSIPASMLGNTPFIGAIDTVAYGRTQVSNFELRGATLNGTVELAGFRFDHPWLEVNPVFSIANIGSGAMRDFTVTFDQHSKIVRFVSSATQHTLAKPRNPAAASPVDELIGTVAVRQTY